MNKDKPGAAQSFRKKIRRAIISNMIHLALFLAISDDNKLNLRNEVKANFDVHEMTVAFAVLLAMSESTLFALSLENLQDINCWLSTIPIESLDANATCLIGFNTIVSAEQAKLNISCIT
jgi:hypothetical protein